MAKLKKVPYPRAKAEYKMKDEYKRLVKSPQVDRLMRGAATKPGGKIVKKGKKLPRWARGGRHGKLSWGNIVNEIKGK